MGLHYLVYKQQSQSMTQLCSASAAHHIMGSIPDFLQSLIGTPTPQVIIKSIPQQLPVRCLRGQRHCLSPDASGKRCTAVNPASPPTELIAIYPKLIYSKREGEYNLWDALSLPPGTEKGVNRP